MKKLIGKFCKIEITPHVNDFFLLAVVFVFSLLRVPSLIEPEWYGDEGIYQVIGVAMQNGQLLYRDIWDNKPPILYIYYALVNGDLFAIKFLSLLFGVAAVVVFFYLSRKLFQGKKIPVYISTSIFVYLFGTPLLEGNVANAENFMLFPILLSLLLITKISSRSSFIIPIASGLLLSLSFLTKIVAIFDLLAFMTILFSLRLYNKDIFEFVKYAIKNPKDFVITMKQELILIVAFLFPVFLTWAYFAVMGASSEFLSATFSNNIGYVGWKNYLQVNLGFFSFSIPQGWLLLKVFMLVVSVVLIVKLRKLFSVPALIIYLWLVFSLFNTFFSGRPYTHYIITLIPAFCLLIGLLFINKKRLIYHVAAILLVIFLVRQNFETYSSTYKYYVNYRDFVMGEKSVSDYQIFFDKIVPKNYAIAEFIKNNTTKDENVFLVSNSSTIYYMAGKLPPGRYIVGYHIESYKNAIDETKNALQEKKPKYIISTNKDLLQNFVENYQLQYVLHNVEIYERQF